MTNCDYAKHEGAKSEKDLLLCLKTFQNIDKHNWLKMCNLNGNKLNNMENTISKNISDISNTALTNIGIINIDENLDGLICPFVAPDSDKSTSGIEIKKFAVSNKKPTMEELRKIRLEKYLVNQING
jgi:hypothetical protein